MDTNRGPNKRVHTLSEIATSMDQNEGHIEMRDLVLDNKLRNNTIPT